MLFRSKLAGGFGKDLIIGGVGKDVLVGGRNKIRDQKEDILIAGTTDYDSTPTDLAEIVNFWNQTNLTYRDRVVALSHGIPSLPAGLNSTTVHGDGARDDIFGSGGPDWIFIVEGQDKILYRRDGEVTRL